MVLGLLGIGGMISGDETDATTRIFVAAFYIIAGLAVVARRNRIAVWWSSSTLLPCGCAALLMFAGVNALSRVEWKQSTPVYTNSSTTVPKTIASNGAL
jgi:hypothetical protein